jgi:hypothetical protein
MPWITTRTSTIYSAFRAGLSINNYNPTYFYEDTRRHVVEYTASSLWGHPLQRLQTYMDSKSRSALPPVRHHASYGEIRAVFSPLPSRKANACYSLCYEVSDPTGMRISYAIRENVNSSITLKSMKATWSKPCFGLHSAFTLS